MRTVTRYVSVIALVLVGLLGTGPAALGGESDGDPVLWFFWGEGCDLCDEAAGWLDELDAAHPGLTVHSIEVWLDSQGRQLYMQMMEERAERASWVPGFILGDEVWEGFNESIAADIECEVEYLLSGGIHGGITGDDPPPPSAPAERPRPAGALALGPFGTVQIGGQSLVAATLLIALVDGFNPCSLWVLTILLAMILNTRSRARIAAVGGTFLLVTAGIYGLFIAGVFTALAVASHLAWIRILVAVLALVFAAVSIKDYFAFKVGPSLTIPDGLKPVIIRGGREVSRERTLPVTLVITVAFAAAAAVIELPCTAGFPAIWTGLVSEAGVAFRGFVALLALYLAVYLLVEILIVAAALITLRVGRLQEVHARHLKLVGGMVMAVLAVVLIVEPGLVEHLAGSLYIVGGALLASVVVAAGAGLYRSRRAGSSRS